MNIEFSTHKRRDLIVYVVLRTLVIVTAVAQFLKGNFENVFLCILTLFLFTLPIIIDQRLNIKLPTVLETIIFLFIFSAEILGEVNNFYIHFKNWDTILHTINGFLCAAIGFSLIDILNRSDRFHSKLSPVFVALVAFCFSMTIGVLWEFIEYGGDRILNLDMQKDTVIPTVVSVNLNDEKSRKPVIVENIDKTIIYSDGSDGASIKTTIIDGGYLDVGLRDTMKDLIVNFIGALVFSFIGWFYIKGRDEYKFAENFIPIRKTEEEIEATKKELQRLEEILREKKRKKKK